MSAIFKYLDIRLCLVLCSAKPPHDNAFGHGEVSTMDISASPALLFGLALVAYSFTWPLV